LSVPRIYRVVLRRFRLALLGGVWGVALVIGLALLWRYESEPAPTRPGPKFWPDKSLARRGLARPTFILFAHPHRPCTQASIAELERLMAESREAAAVQVWFVGPRERSSGWEDAPLVDRTTAIPGVQVFWDSNRDEARRFGATTSGEIFMYGTDG